jgi:hypothetical protein
MLMAIERLRQVSDLCQEGKPMDENLANWFGGCLGNFLERRSESFEEAFGLPSCRGGVPWWKEEQASAWRIDRNYEDMPPAYAGTPKEFLWQAFQSGAPMPLGERQLRNIVA